MGFSATSAPDPYWGTFPATQSEFYAGYEINGKTRVSSVINPAIRNLITIDLGQSNFGNNMPSLYTVTNTGKVDNFNFNDGATYSASDPLLGPARDSTSLGKGNNCGRLADKLLNANKFDRHIIAPIPISGSTAADWETGIGKDRIARLVNRFNAKGWFSVGGTTIIVRVGQGEQDNFNGTTQTAYFNSWTNIIANARAAGLPSSIVWFFAQQTLINGTTSSAIRAAQAALVNHSSNIWAGPDADTLTGTNRQADNTHFSDVGADAYAGLWQTALAAFGAPF